MVALPPASIILIRSLWEEKKKQPLTDMPVKKHQALHNDLNDHLDGYTDGAGNNMRPRRGNSGKKIRRNFSRDERLDALADFYKANRKEYRGAAKDFFDQHPELE